MADILTYYGCQSNSSSLLKFDPVAMRSTMEPRFNEPLFTELLGITNNIFGPTKVTVKCMEQNLDLTNRFPQPKLKIYLKFTSI